ncbi:glycosyltransferase [uncultured Bacteroides sp.]|uniref:glycosyltransferase n=1 Tax=uncultured Bacteroides sp. TaxID=162156 RepID=UPI002AAAF78E|nr:glycosyltransferase [uncultured Bacteroides sp.]
MDELIIIDTLDTILFFLMAISVGYLFVFAVASMSRMNYSYPLAKKKYRFAILFPAYKEDKVIEQTMQSFLQQEYLKESYDVVVISDKMKDSTNQRLRQLPIDLLIVDFENSSKAKALNFGMDQLADREYDMIVILDADNTVQPNFLQQISNAYESGANVIQAHRMAKNLNTSTAILDAVSEEINNSIFRKGHVKLGLSSALIGSGMVFEYGWFKENIKKVSSAGEDKELEMLLLKQRVYIDYMDNIPVYDEKTQKENAFNNQRRRWLSAQFASLWEALPDLPDAIFTRNIDYCDKIFQWMMLPRVLMIGVIGLLSIATTFINWEWSIKWWILLLILFGALCMAIPDYLVNKPFKKAIIKVPLLAFMMFLNLFRTKGVNKKFIHTEHGEH